MLAEYTVTVRARGTFIVTSVILAVSCCDGVLPLECARMSGNGGVRSSWDFKNQCCIFLFALTILESLKCVTERPVDELQMRGDS